MTTFKKHPVKEESFKYLQVHRLLTLDHPRFPISLTSSFSPPALILGKSEALIRRKDNSKRKEKSSPL